jgi:hypothetical protein
MRGLARLAGLSCALALVLLLGACAKNGQFDPTEFFSADMFDTKKKLRGERKDVFPAGVPGATTGVPPDLVKGYQPPPDPAMAEQMPPGASPEPGAAPAGAPAATAEATPTEEPAKPKHKAKPKPKVARARASDPIWDRKPANPPTRIEVNRPQAAAPATQPQQQQAASPWPDPHPPQQQAGQSVWPDPPAPGSFSR